MISVLDHGYIKLIETWGSDESIVRAARMSTDKGFLGWEPTYAFVCLNDKCKMPYSCSMPDPIGAANLECPNCGEYLIPDKENTHRGDQKLLKYLYEHKHMTPFEMAGMVIEVQAPIFVFREWHRHRTQSYNEMSARYIPLPDVNYVPTIERLMTPQTTNKQAQSTGLVLDIEGAKLFQSQLRLDYGQQEGLYQQALARGVPKELARLVIPVGRYSRMRAQANLRGWLMFLDLRMEKSAQWEIQQYANVVADLIKEKFPRTYGLFDGGRHA